MRRLLPIALIAACAAVEPGPADQPDDDTDAGDPDPTLCRAEVTEVSPSGTEVALDAVVQAWFSEPVALDDLLLDVDGVPGHLTLDDDGLHATYVPDQLLQHATTYEIRAAACDDLVITPFTTQPAPLDAATLDGEGWFVSFTGAHWEYPSIADLIDPLGSDGLLLEATRESSGGLQLSVAIGSSVEDQFWQSECYPASVLGPVDLTDNPWFAAGPGPLTLPIGDGALLEDAMVFGKLTDGGQTLQEVELLGSLDTRTIDATLCELADYLGEPCEPCADGARACLTAYLVLGEGGDAEVDVDDTYAPAQDADCF